MKIILISDVKKQGKKGDILDVKDGYGKFLINNHQAVLHTNTSLERLNDEKQKQKEDDDKNRQNALNIKDKLSKEKILFKVKTGAGDKVFGSISTKQICEELKKLGYNIDKKQIILDIPISSLGMFDVKVNLYKDINGIIKIEVGK